jgi:BirA family biotin operon repressor/biotin-[acetyl-CoA-carboxylase] ligase
MENGKLQIIYFEEIDSTQKYLIEKIKNEKFIPPVCVWSELQTDGIGSKNNKWIGKKGNLFFSCAFEKDKFEDIPLQSLSIYFGWIFKKTLNELGSKAVMKWPNDIYLIDKKPLKIGGVITNLIKNKIICGIGLNTKFTPSNEFGSLDIEIKNDKILKRFFSNLEKRISWNSVINEFNPEFEKYKRLFFIDAILAEDGSLQNNEKRIYSKR